MAAEEREGKPGKRGRTKDEKVKFTMHSRNVDLMRALERGDVDLDDWDNEELKRGYRRARDGTFRGRPPNVIPRVVHQELVARVKSKVQQEMLMVMDESVVPVLRDAMRGNLDPETAQVQLRAAQWLYERVFGPDPIKVEVSGGLKHEQIIDSVTVNRGALDDGTIVDAEVIDDEDFEFE